MIRYLERIGLFRERGVGYPAVTASTICLESRIKFGLDWHRNKANGTVRESPIPSSGIKTSVDGHDEELIQITSKSYKAVTTNIIPNYVTVRVR